MMRSNREGLPVWLTAFLLLLILTAGGALRWVGLDWDAEQHLHPDERFLTMVESSIIPVKSLGHYFNTSTSTLNPANQGHSFFVYGTLPIFIIRYLAEWLGYAGYGSVYLVGRALSAGIDLLTVMVAFMIATRLWDRRVGLLGAAFSAFAVLQIQQSHFFTVDTFITFFSLLAVYFAVEVADSTPDKIRFSSFALFGMALGMAVASKINAAPVALTLPLAVGLMALRARPEKRVQDAPKWFVYLTAAALISIITFRVFQPYAFQGPGFLNFRLNESWVGALKSLRAQTSGDVDFPPALQWARRPVWFSLKNMVIWGLGIPLGLTAWLGFAGWGYKSISKRSWHPGLVVWGWTAVYFTWQSLQWNSTMRYQLPIYPLLCIFAAWLIIQFWDSAADGWVLLRSRLRVKAGSARLLAAVFGALVLTATAAWGFAFSRIYTTPHPRVAATEWIFQNIPGPANLILETDSGQRQQLLPYPAEKVIQPGEPWLSTFSPRWDGELKQLTFPKVVVLHSSDEPVRVQISLLDPEGGLLQSAALDFPGEEATHQAVLDLEEGIQLNKDQNYQIRLETILPDTAVKLKSAGIANESSWDDGLPLRYGGYDPFGGIYQGGLNFEMYWDDNQEKLDLFLTTLDQADYILITSSRQWATTTRVPERYPLTTKYYRELMGCPPRLTVEECYNRAQPGDFQGRMGFELREVFQSAPVLGPVIINDQPAEEAFTVYDHPKVFIFQKTDQFRLDQAAAELQEVDLSRVIHITPKQADSYPGDLMLPLSRLVVQRQGGTWSKLFDTGSLINRSQAAATLIWYLSVTLVGLVVFPLMRPILRGLKDRGYPLARIFGLLLLSYLAWLAGSAEIPFSRNIILMILVLLAAAGGTAAYLQRESLTRQWKEQKKYLLIIEGIALAVFVVGLLIRIGNPDLWHPWKGGEKPMDFSYFNAVLKSTTFPPFDPWFSGGYINYYYYGFVFVGVLVKLLGIVPAVAYNLILPTLLMMTGVGVFSIVWNIFQHSSRGRETSGNKAYLAGGAGLLGMILLGNLGILRMIFQGIQRAASGGLDPTNAGPLNRLIWTAMGLIRVFKTGSLGYRLDEWYWNPSRAIGAEHGGPITEFPAFTFLYGDLHAHFLALPLTVLAIAWMVSVVLSRANSSKTPSLAHSIAAAGLGALAVGVLRPTNTWDFYPYLALGGAAIAFSWVVGWRRKKAFPWGKAGLQLVVFVGLAYLFFQPYASWYGEGYTSVQNWYGSKTPWNDYFTHWGLFLFVVITWMISETIHWMANTPVSALKKLKQVRELIIGLVLLLLVTMISQGVNLEEGLNWRGIQWVGAGVHIIWFVLPFMVWAAILLFRREQPLAKQIVIFLIGTALAITLMVELVYVEGDIGRMNTVFKFYLQAWTLLAICSGAALGWLLGSLPSWPRGLRTAWTSMFIFLFIGAALYPVLGGVAKVKDRMALEAPHTLDGMRFMKHAVYYDLNAELDLEEDYQAIRWMQENIPGSPVIVEANQVEYHWGTRFTVYTGNPGVVGWNWHQRQQRTITPHEWVFNRVEDVNQFYNSPDLGFAKEFLEKYQVSYIVVGELERAKYDALGLEKFSAAEGVLWDSVYQDQDTIIYQTQQGIEP